DSGMFGYVLGIIAYKAKRERGGPSDLPRAPVLREPDQFRKSLVGGSSGPAESLGSLEPNNSLRIAQQVRQSQHTISKILIFHPDITERNHRVDAKAYVGISQHLDNLCRGLARSRSVGFDGRHGLFANAGVFIAKLAFPLQQGLPVDRSIGLLSFHLLIRLLAASETRGGQEETPG